MDNQLSRGQDDLGQIERRLAAWQPTTEGLEADAMLFAAGLAAGRRRRARLWPTLCALLIVQVAALGAWIISERSERLNLSSELAKHASSPAVIPQPPQDMATQFEYTPSPNDYLHQRRRVEQDANYYLASVTSIPPAVFDPRLHPTTILRAGQWSNLLE